MELAIRTLNADGNRTVESVPSMTSLARRLATVGSVERETRNTTSRDLVVVSGYALIIASGRRKWHQQAAPAGKSNLQRAIVINASKEGVRLRIPDASLHLYAPEILIAMCDVGDPLAHMSLGLIRWIRRIRRPGIAEVGVRLLSREAKVVAVKYVRTGKYAASWTAHALMLMEPVLDRYSDHGISLIFPSGEVPMADYFEIPAKGWVLSPLVGAARRVGDGVAWPCRLASVDVATG
jgi:hypothetical protein